MTLAKKLFELQLLETDIASKEQAVEDITARLEDDSLLKRAKTELESEQKYLKELKERQHSLEREIEDLNEKLSSDKNALYGGSIKNPKELENLQHDVENLKKRLDALEDKALVVMEEAEKVEMAVADSQQKLKRLEEEQINLKQELNKERDEITVSLNELKKKRELVLGDIDQETYKLYCLLKEQKKTAVARLERGACRSCGIAITSAWQQRARSGELVKCTSCGRILYIGN